MAGQELVRPSRDGDQFHYHWAARQCLRLLPGASDLVAVTIEGPSTAEAASDTIAAGEEIIDVGFYYGDEERDRARFVHYVQLKHSTRHSGEPWTASGLQKTLEGFAQRYMRLLDRFHADNVARRFRFEFASNRPIDSKVQESLADLASGAAARHSDVQQLLTRYSELTGAQVQQFFSLFVVTGGEGDLWEQRHLLVQDISRYLVGADSETPLELKELVTRKATTEFERDPSIRRHDVLRALKATEEQLRPAPCLLPDPKDTLPREQEQEVLRTLLAATTPVIIHADGGVGKSVLAARLAASIPANSEGVLYDCFGNGLYRNALGFRHRHRDALVQIANELAARGLCHPLVPTAHADVKQYMHAFMGRLTQAAESLRARDPNATLCLIIDAADNAAMAADEHRDSGSFVRDLIGAPFPQGVRVAFTCRSHRRSLLYAPPGSQEVELRAFSQAESARHLRTRYSEASDVEASEFAFLSSSNPRVQAFALSRSTSIQEMLKQLGPEPTTVDRAIGALLEAAIERLKYSASGVEAEHIDMICRGLAVFRPLVPVPVLAKVSGTSEGAVRSLVLDLGRPLILKGDSVHFLDEPTETWFRERFGPETTDLATFVERMRPLTTKNAYAAAALPQFLLQLGRFEELVQLALSDDNLPSENPLERRDVKLQRLRFALKACIKRRNYVAAAKLALKAGGECAGEQRQNQVIKDHTDVAGVLMAPDRMEGLVARRIFDDSWRGSHYAYDAGLLSGRAEHFAEASSRLRMAKDWLRAWARRTDDQRQHNERVSTEDITEIAIVMLRLEGATAAAQFLKGWTPRHLSFLAGRQAGRRLIDLGRADQLDELANAARRDPWLMLGLCAEVNAVGGVLPAVSLDRLMRFLQRPHVKLPEIGGWNEPWVVLDAVRSAIELALGGLPHEREAWAKVLCRYLPAAPHESNSLRYGTDRIRLWRAYALEAALRGQQVSVEAVTPTGDRQQASGRRAEDRDLFRSEAGALIPWFILSAEIVCGRPPSDLPNTIQSALKGMVDTERRVYQDQKPVRQHVALEWLRILHTVPNVQRDQVGALSSWLSEQKPELPVDTLIALCRSAARGNGLERLAMNLAEKTYSALESSRDSAELRADSFLKLARAILTVSDEDARGYFNHAVEISSRIGDENLERWVALLNLATKAAERETPRPRTAYRLSRIAELTHEYVVRDKHFPWDSTVETLADLCPASALAILSRWRDRRFGRNGQVLPIVVNRLLKNGLLPESTPVALAGIIADWDRAEDLERALSSERDPAIRAALANAAYRYIRVKPSSAQTWITLERLREQYDLDLPDFERLSRAAGAGSDGTTDANDLIHKSHAGDENGRRSDWDAFFQDADLSDPSVLRALFADHRERDRPYRHEAFFREALTRVKPGREHELIRAVAAWPDFNYFTLKDLLQALPSPLPSQLAMRNALREIVFLACQREPHRCQLIGWFEVPPHHVLRVGGLISDNELAVAALEGVAAQADRMDARELFQSIGPLALVLSPAQAEDALDFGFDLLDELLKPEDGDGEWREGLRSRGTLTDTLAGYIWAGLGSAAASERWQYAHVVRTIVELGQQDLLCAVIAMAENDAAVFTDRRLVFYGWHARQWLLIGLARGAIENPTALRPTFEFLQMSLVAKHVVIRELAAQVLQTLSTVDGGGAAVAADLAVNRPKAVQVDSGFVKAEDDASATDLEADEKYFFGFDVGPYWFEPLGRAFGLSQRVIERRAVAVLRKELGWEGDLDWREDERRKRKLFDDGEDDHSHGSLPKADDILTYHAYHAMMMVAASLLSERAVRHQKGERVNEFVDWISRYMLTRSDGRWIADRRGPRIIPEITTQQEHWRWSVSASYLDQQLTTEDGFTVLGGGWQNGASDRYESVAVRCALVSTVGAASLLAALQTAPELDPFALPYASEVLPRQVDDNVDDDGASDYQDSESYNGVDAGPLKLSGLLSYETAEARLDGYDPWGEGVPFPGRAPSKSIVSRLDLRQREDGTVWESPRGGIVRTEIWVQTQRAGRRDETVPGERISANAQFLSELLAANPDRTLILSVSIRRHPSSYDRDNDDFDSFQQAYVRYYLMGGNGVATPL